MQSGGAHRRPGEAAPPQSTTVRIKVRILATILWSLTTTIIVLGAFRQISVYRLGQDGPWGGLRLINLDAEMTIASWYSSTLMTLAALLLVLSGAVARTPSDGNRWHWWALALIFIYMSLDETVQIHELASMFLPGRDNFPAIFHFTWVVLAAPLMLVVGLAFVPFLLRLPRRIAGLIVLSGLIYVSGAFVMELVAGYIVAEHGPKTAGYYASVVAEEGLELAGLTMFVYTLGALQALRPQPMRVTVTS